MKYLFFALPLIAFLISCDKSNELAAPLSPPQYFVPKDLTLEFGRAHIPFDLFSKSNTAVFINSKGEEKKFDIQFSLDTIMDKMEGYNYSKETLEISYIPTTVADKNCSMWLLARVQYADSAGYHIVNEQVSVNGPITNNNTVWSQIMFITGWKDNSCLNRIIPEIEIAGNHFNTVFADPFPDFPAGNSYTEIFYTTDLGIVGFQGYQGEMWALKQME